MAIVSPMLPGSSGQKEDAFAAKRRKKGQRFAGRMVNLAAALERIAKTHSLHDFGDSDVTKCVHFSRQLPLARRLQAIDVDHFACRTLIPQANVNPALSRQLKSRPGFASVAQWIEYCPPKAGVAGSIPAGRTNDSR